MSEETAEKIERCAYGHPSETTVEGKVLCAKPEYGQCPNAEVPPLKVDDWNALQELIREALSEAFDAGQSSASSYEWGCGGQSFERWFKDR